MEAGSNPGVTFEFENYLLVALRGSLLLTISHPVGVWSSWKASYYGFG